jgi:RNA polymerase sigma factor (sigma-70 family)
MSFPTTHRSVIAAAASSEPALRREALDAIITAYWKPVYKYVRLKWNKDSEDARDITQEFFTSALDRGLFERYDAARALFRTYLRTCVDHHVLNETEAASRIKRGGTVTLVELDYESADHELAISSNGARDMEEYFHREWMRHLFSLAVEDLRLKCEKENKSGQFRAFQLYDLAAERPSYGNVAAELSLTETTVTNYLAWARRQLRQLLLDRVAEITGCESEYNDEARFLLGWKQR